MASPVSWLTKAWAYYNPVYNQGGGGIKLKVFAKDVERCRDILADDQYDLPEENQ
jgi:hypothetical protein